MNQRSSHRNARTRRDMPAHNHEIIHKTMLVYRFINAIKSPTSSLRPRFPGSFFSWRLTVGSSKPWAPHRLPLEPWKLCWTDVPCISNPFWKSTVGALELQKRWEWIRNFHSWPIQRRVWGIRFQCKKMIVFETVIVLRKRVDPHRLSCQLVDGPTLGHITTSPVIRGEGVASALWPFMIGRRCRFFNGAGVSMLRLKFWW